MRCMGRMGVFSPRRSRIVRSIKVSAVFELMDLSMIRIARCWGGCLPNGPEEFIR